MGYRGLIFGFREFFKLRNFFFYLGCKRFKCWEDFLVIWYLKINKFWKSILLFFEVCNLLDWRKIYRDLEVCCV